MSTLTIRGDRLLLALDWNDYLRQFVPIDDWNPFDGDMPPSTNARGFTTDEDALATIAGYYIEEEEGGVPESLSVLHDPSARLRLLRHLLTANPFLMAVDIDIRQFLEVPGCQGGLCAERPVGPYFTRFLAKLASGNISEKSLMAPVLA